MPGLGLVVKYFMVQSRSGEILRFGGGPRASARGDEGKARGRGARGMGMGMGMGVGVGVGGPRPISHAPSISARLGKWTAMNRPIPQPSRRTLRDWDLSPIQTAKSPIRARWRSGWEVQRRKDKAYPAQLTTRARSVAVVHFAASAPAKRSRSRSRFRFRPFPASASRPSDQSRPRRNALAFAIGRSPRRCPALRPVAPPAKRSRFRYRPFPASVSRPQTSLAPAKRSRSRFRFRYRPFPASASRPSDQSRPGETLSLSAVPAPA